MDKKLIRAIFILAFVFILIGTLLILKGIFLWCLI